MSLLSLRPHADSLHRTKLAPLTIALGVAFFGAMTAAPAAQAAETAAQAAKKPVQPPQPLRLADGTLNLTGFWAPVIGLLSMNIGLGGTPPNMPPPPPPFGHFPDLKSPYKEKLGAFMANVAKGRVDDPVAQCFPPGMPRMMSMIYGMELLQTPGQIAITSEWQAASRRIWLNQKQHTAPDELDPSYTGESIGHWEGDTLVVDTIGIKESVPLNFLGLPHSDKLHVVEKFTEKQPGILIDEVTIDDPDVFVSPWTETETFRYRPDLRIEEFVCLDNNRNVGPNGEATFQK